MREIKPSILSFLLIVFLLLFVVPASATDYNGSFDNGLTGTITRDFHIEAAGAGVNPITSIWFNNCELYQHLGSVKVWTTEAYIDLAGTSSTQNITDVPATLSRDGVTACSLGWFRYEKDMHNNYYISYYCDDPTGFNMGVQNGTDFLLINYDTSLFTLSLFGAGSNSDPYFAGFGNSAANSVYAPQYLGAQVDADGRFTNWYNVYTNRSGSVPFRTLTLYRNGPLGPYGTTTYRYYSNLKINQSSMGYPYNRTLYNQGGNGDVQVDYLPLNYPLYVEVTDQNGMVYPLYIPPEYSLSLTVNPGQTSGIPAETDQPVLATLQSSANLTSRYMVWKWSENFDTFLSGTSSQKRRVNGYATFQYNSTNRTSMGNWELYAYGFENKGILPSSVNWGSYTWEQIRSRSIYFNWSMSDPSWESSTDLSSPYNYVELSLYDDYSNLVGRATRNVYVGLGNKARFHIFTMQSDLTTKVLDTNIYIFDVDANPGTWVVNGVNATYGTYLAEVNISHSHYIWSSAARYWLVRGIEVPSRAPQALTNGCVTYSIPFPGEQEIILVMDPTSGTANTTVLFTVESVPDDLISPKQRVPGAKITLTSQQTTDVIYTDGNGQASFLMISNPVLTYYYTVEYVRGADCTQTASGYFNSVSHHSQYVLLDACSQITTQPTVTPTTVPTTPSPAGGCSADWQPGTQNCRDHPENQCCVCASKDPISALKCLFMSSGMTGNNGGLMLALVISAFLAFVFGYYISFQASLIGAFVGFVFSLAFGLIPMWLLIALIIIGGVFFTGKWWSGSGGG